MITTDTPNGLQAQLKISSGYQLEVSGDVDIILPLLRNVPGVISVLLENHSTTNSGKRHILKVACKSRSEPGKDIAKLIVTQGLELHELRRTCPSLEDIFLKLTTEEPLSINNL